MLGFLRGGDLFIGAKKYYGTYRKGKPVNIVDTENHPIYGKRYLVNEYAQHKEWFEENCFSLIIDDSEEILYDQDLEN